MYITFKINSNVNKLNSLQEIVSCVLGNDTKSYHFTIFKLKLDKHTVYDLETASKETICITHPLFTSETSIS